jgi:hypothetical protein
LFLLFVRQPDLFASHPLPDWVSQWRDQRAQRAKPKPAKRAAASDSNAQARRAKARDRKVQAGLAALERWLRDWVRAGLANAPGQPYQFWDTPAKRMVDAQAPGLARLVRELAGSAASGAGWQERLLERLARLHLLLAAYRQLESLPSETQADVRSAIGWTQDQDELLKQDGVRDQWCVLAQRVSEEDALRVQRTWLWGERSRRAALILHFAHKSQPLDTSLSAGTCLDAELVFYPGAYPLRALCKTRCGSPLPLAHLPAYDCLAAALEAYARALARNPWLERFPMAVHALTPAQQAGRLLAVSAEQHSLPLHPQFEKTWQLFALSGGQPLTLFGEWDGEYWLPLSAWAESRFVSLV